MTEPKSKELVAALLAAHERAVAEDPAGELSDSVMAAAEYVVFQASQDVVNACAHLLASELLATEGVAADGK